MLALGALHAFQGQEEGTKLHIQKMCQHLACGYEQAQSLNQVLRGASIYQPHTALRFPHAAHLPSKIPLWP